MLPRCESNFRIALRAFQAGSVSYDEFLAQLDRQIRSGAKCDELLDVLQRRAYIDALPADVYATLVRRLKHPAPAVAGQAVGEPGLAVSP